MPVEATVRYDAAIRKVTLNPNDDLQRGTTCTAMISTGGKDASGNALAAPETRSFTARQ